MNYSWLNEDSRTFLKRDYLLEGVTPEQRILQIALHAEKILGIEGFSTKFENYMSRGFYSLSTPVWTNFGTDRGLPVSCFGSYIPDDTAGIFDKVGEVGIMSKMGGGTSAFFGDVRERGAPIKNNGFTDGPIRFMELFDKTADVISQGSARRGSFVAYLPIDHPDIEEFLQIRDEGHTIQNMSMAVNITDQWMEEMISGDKSKRSIWGKVIKKRFESGYPYLHFIDNVNNAAPKVYRDKGMKIKASNLCNETSIFSDEENSFVCVLSSLNASKWDEIKDTDAVEMMIKFLDAVNEEFVQKTNTMPYMKAANKFAKEQRALGMGILGWHSYLQSKMIAFESLEAKMLNSEIWRAIRERSDKATEDLAKTHGEPELLKGYGRRNVTTLAVAPTTSSAFILGQVSPSIEPENSCYYVKKLAKGSFTYKNPYLKNLLKKKGQDNNEIWSSILVNGGSVQHLDFLSEEEKDVFKTFGEISQKEVVIQAAQRIKYIDQSQSLNLMIPSNAKPKDVSDLLIEGWRMGLKGFYYHRSTSPSQDLMRNIMTCKSCEA